MKFTGTLLALLSVSGASAFTPMSSQTRSTALFSSDMRRGPANTMERNTGRGPSVRRNSPGGQMAPVVNRGDVENMRNEWDDQNTEIIQGNSLRTWSFMSPAVERIQVMMGTNGRPLNADVELWQGPSNTPQKMSVYLEDGERRSFSAVIESPRGSNTVAIRNTAQMEFPLTASVEPDIRGGQTPALADYQRQIVEGSRGRTIQGGAIVTFPFDPSVQKVSVCMTTDGRPLNARIELLQGPNNNKQVVEVYCEDGDDRPFMMILDTPGVGSVVRIVNTATVEFPLNASVDPFLIEDRVDDMSMQGSGGSMDRLPGQNRGGNDDFFFSRR